MSHAARTESRRASIMLSLLQTFQHRHYRWIRLELADVMRARASWTVVNLLSITAHVDAESAVGRVFGLLADARVQLLEADDETRLYEFLALGAARNFTMGASFGPQDLLAVKEDQWDAVKAVFGSEDSAPVMCPAIMFRLCKRNVHVGP